MKDSVYRQDAIDAFWSLDAELRPSAINAILNMLNGLPSAEKKGKWIDPDDGYPPYCSECGENCIEYLESAFCPHCGAEMEESDG